MNIVVVGLNYKTSPIEAREACYLRITERELLLSELKHNPSVAAAIVLSTCNRTEIYAHTLEENPQSLLHHLLGLKNLSFDSAFRKYFYTYHGKQAVRHLFEVSAGLDSLILGEKQILGQLKDAIELSRKKGMMNREFNILAHLAIRVGKKVRNETLIESGGSSVSWAAVSTAKKALGTLKGKSVLIIGAGKMGHLAVSSLRQKQAGQIYIMNRTADKAASLAREYGGLAVDFWDLKSILEVVDVCICSAECPHYLIEKDLVEKIMETRRHKRLICIDISIPRNISPAIADLNDVSLFSIDDLEKAVEENVRQRHTAIPKVEEIISEKIIEFYRKITKGYLRAEGKFSEIAQVS